jgi:hypothetical protein
MILFVDDSAIGTRYLLGGGNFRIAINSRGHALTMVV